MSFLVSGQPQTTWGNLNDNADTAIYTATKKTTIVSMGFSENEGTTSTLRVWRENAAGDEYDIRSTLAVTARQRVVIDEVLTLNTADSIHIQSSDASGAFDWTVTILAPDAAVGGNHH